MRGADEAAVDHPDARLRLGHLRAHRRPRAPRPGTPHERSRRPSTPRAPYEVARRGPRQMPRARGPRASENEPTQTRSQASVRRIRSTSGTERGLGLDVDVPAGLGELLQQVLEERQRLRARHPGLAHLAPTAGPRSGPRGVGHPVQGRVVEGDQPAVGRGVHVGLEVAVAERCRPAEGGGGVLDPVRRAAAVGERDRDRGGPGRGGGARSPAQYGPLAVTRRRRPRCRCACPAGRRTPAGRAGPAGRSPARRATVPMPTEPPSSEAGARPRPPRSPCAPAGSSGPVQPVQSGHQPVARAGAEAGRDVEAGRHAVQHDARDQQRDPGGQAVRRPAPAARVPSMREADDEDVGDRAEAGALPQRDPQQQHRGADDDRHRRRWSARSARRGPGAARSTARGRGPPRTSSAELAPYRARPA